MKDATTPAASPVAGRLTAVDFSHTGNFAALIQQLGVSLLVSTYQAGSVLAIGQHQGKLQIRFHHFEQAMGMARTPTGLAIGSRQQIWYLEAAPALARSVRPPGTYECAFLTRHSHFTGPIMGHDLAWAGGELWVANTGFSCLSVIKPEYSFVPRWRPSFISTLAGDDRCHLNGLAADDHAPRYVTALGETDTAARLASKKGDKWMPH